MAGRAAAPDPLRARLAEGDRRTPGRAAEVAREVAGSAALVPALLDCLADADPVVAAHAAHAAMQAARERPALFAPHAARLIGLLEAPGLWEIGEQVPKLLAGQALGASDAARLARALEARLGDRSAIAAAAALSGLIDMAARGLADAAKVEALVAAALASPSKALAARARRLAPPVRASRGPTAR